MYDTIIRLISEKNRTDEYGDRITETTEREVYAELKSIGQTEFYQAQAAGLKPEMKLLLSDYLDYREEKYLKYTDDTGEEREYSIIRTYRAGNGLEITCKRGVEE